MLKVGVIGIGNAGNQVAALAKEAGFDAIALNSSQKDLSTVKDTLMTIVIGDERGAGKDRNTAKNFIKTAIKDIISENAMGEAIDGKDIVAIVAGSGGGTGSGIAPLLHAVLSNTYKKTRFIMMGIVPPLSESLAGQQNNLEYLQEMKRDNPRYMLYDNGRFERLGTVSMFRKINEEIVEDLKVIRGDYQTTTPFSSIDENDSMKMYSTNGRIVIGRVSGFREKDLDELSIESRIINSIKAGAHAELETDRIVKREGLIINLNNNLYETMDTTIPAVKKAFGEPVEGFEHITISENGESNVVLVMTGLSFPDDRIIKTIQRIEEIQSKLTEHKTSVLDDFSLSGITEIRKDDSKEVQEEIVDVEDIMSRF